MKKIYFLLLLPFLYYFSQAAGCASSGTTEMCRDLIYGKYYYTMSDSLDNKLLEGVINVSDFEGNKIGGTYSKDKLYVDDFPGYTSMQGFFSGSVDIKGMKANINTNPKIADNNIFISIEINKESLTGKWTLSTMRGKIGNGKFSAVKVK